MSDIIVWADIPTADLKRAMAFYEHVTKQPVVLMPGAADVAVIGNPAEGHVVSADLYQGGTPSADGPTIYLGSGGDIDGMLARVVEAGGTIVKEKEFMGDMVGWIAFVLDTEGNRIGIEEMGE